MKAHITNFGIENFRVFKNKTQFEFAPITILTGTNSSGKSSLINAMEIFKFSNNVGEQSNFTLWEDENKIIFNSFKLTPSAIDKKFGRFNSFLNNAIKKPAIKYYFKSHGANVTLSYSQDDSDIRSGVLIGIQITDSVTDEKILFINAQESNKIFMEVNYGYMFTKIHKICHSVEKNNAQGKMKMTHRDGMFSIMKSTVNKILTLPDIKIPMYVYKPFTGLLSKAKLQRAIEEYEFERVSNDLDNLYSDFSDIVDPLNNQEFLFAEEVKVLDNFCCFVENSNGIGINSDDLSNVFEVVGNPLSAKAMLADKDLFISRFKAIDFSSIEFNSEYKEAIDAIYKTAIVKNLAYVLDFTSLAITSKLSTARVTVKRSYSDYDSRDAFTKFIKELETVVKAKKDDAKSKSLIFLEKSLRTLKIADSIVIEEQSDGSSSAIFLMRKDEKILLADVGYGISQVLIFLFSIVSEAQKIEDAFYKSYYESTECSLTKFASDFVSSCIVIEEPEASLHPANQSKLADIICEAAKTFNIQFIIETHSEYLIRKLQYLTAKGEIKPEDTVIYYFYPPDDVPPGEEQVKKINITEDGSLTDDFGSGFFDEATNWKFELLKLNNPQKN